jgi:N-acetyl-alpha-D-glucosaminyl L-malate synthase BshA
MAKKMLEEDGIYLPMITTLHGTDITLVGKHPFYKPAVTFSINKSDVVTSVSASLKKNTLDLFDIKQDIEVIPNFIDKRKYSTKFTDCQRSLMATDEERIITHISNFRKVKRIPDIIHIFDKIQKEIPAKLIMVGEGPEKEGAELLVEKLGLSDRVVFLGNSNQIDKILCFSDLFLLPSESESFGLAALEAMINKVPVISSNAGGIAEVNQHGITGFLSDIGNIDEMAANALRILRDDNELEKFKANAVKVAETFDIANVLPLYEAVYEKAYKARFNTSY